MKTLTIIATLLLTAGIVNTASAADQPAQSASIGGGVKNPWSPPYTLALVAVPEPTSLTLLGIGAGALILRRRSR